MITPGSISSLEQPGGLLAKGTVQGTVSTSGLFTDDLLCAGQTPKLSTPLPTASDSQMVSPMPGAILNRKISSQPSTLEFIPLPNGGYAILVNSALEMHQNGGLT